MMRSLSVLIIDDSKLINNSLTSSLRKRGFEVTQAFDLASAKEIIQDKSFDYALLDLELPDGVGEDLLPFLQIHEEIRVIVLTADRDKQRREYLFSFGIVIDYIVKERYFDDMELAIVQLIQRVATNASLNVLIVDDSKFMRIHLRILLSKRGFNVYDAIDGKEALKVIKSHKIDGAIIDLEMPIMDGNKLLYMIKRDRANLLMPVMVVSGTSDVDKIARVIKNGASDFIRKPYSNEELLLKVDKMMDELKNQRLLKVHESRFAMYNRAIDEAAIFLKFNKELEITHANPYFCELLGKSFDEIKNQNLNECIDVLSKEEYLKLQNRLDEKNGSFQDVFSFKTHNLEPLSLRLTFTPLRNQDEEIDEIIAIGFDVSLLQKKEDVLKKQIERESHKNWEQNKLLIQQSKMASMGEMIDHIGHQWRQPLNSLGLLFQKMSVAYTKDKLSPEMVASSTQKAMRITKQMSKTIDDFRNFFRSDKEWIEVDVASVVLQAYHIIEPTLLEHKIRLNRNTSSDITLKCLKNELAQVILNLIANAMDAIVENQIQNGEISIEIDETDTHVEIIVDDNAGGIPEKIMDRIFEPYFTTKQKTKGTGIGLYMSKNIIEDNMYGALSVENTLSGASFTIRIPKKTEIENG